MSKESRKRQKQQQRLKKANDRGQTGLDIPDPVPQKIIKISAAETFQNKEYLENPEKYKQNHIY